MPICSVQINRIASMSHKQIHFMAATFSRACFLRKRFRKSYSTLTISISFKRNSSSKVLSIISLCRVEVHMLATINLDVSQVHRGTTKVRRRDRSASSLILRSKKLLNSQKSQVCLHIRCKKAQLIRKRSYNSCNMNPSKVS